MDFNTQAYLVVDLHSSAADNKAQAQLQQIPQIRVAIVDFLDAFNHKISMSWDLEFEAKCRKEAHDRGYLTVPEPFLQFGVSIAGIAYGHLPDERAKIYIALYTMLMGYLDDCSQREVEGIQHFSQRFLLNQPQEDKILDDIASLLHELPRHWGAVASNMILTASLEFFTSLLVDFETRGIQVHECALDYPAFSRRISGLSTAYTTFVFPAQLPISSFIQSIPELMTFANYANDVMSFYKEEKAGEELNHVSPAAALRRVSKLEALKIIAADAREAYRRIMNILEGNKEAQASFNSYTLGYLDFHIVSKRYKLAELNL